MRVSSPRSEPRRRTGLIAAIAGAVLALDAASKALAVHYLSGRGTVDVLGGAFHLRLYRNFAAAGNRWEGHPVEVSLFTVLAVAVMLVAVARVRTTFAALALGLMLGGGIGNLLDRLLRAPGPLRGGVVDWLKPTLSSGSMNLADLAVTAAVILVLASGPLGWWREREARSARHRGAALGRPDDAV